jgi:vancomycin resistance protein YoaR
MNKISKTVLVTIIAAAFLTGKAFGQTAPIPIPVSPAPVAPQAPAAAPAPQAKPVFEPPASPVTPRTSYAHHYLQQNVVLTEEDKTFYASRNVLGCTFAPGMSDKTISTAIQFAVNDDQLTHFLTKLEPRVDSKAAKSVPRLVKPFFHETAMLSDNVARPAVVVPAEPATTLDIAGSVIAINESLTTQPLVVSVPLTVKTGAAAPTSASLTGIDARLSHFVTHFDTAEVGRTMTVHRAIELVDGTVVGPGQIFSINQTVGERTVARGFGIGKVFINGTMENQVGGGMCQVATTLFNAVLLANLKIVERHQHVRTVPYVPAGGDATVYFGEKDFQFQNNTQAPVYIYYKTYGVFAVCDLYGKGEPNVKVRVVTIPTQLGQRYFKGVIRRYVTENGKTVNDYTAYSTYKWTPALDYQR